MPAILSHPGVERTLLSAAVAIRKKLVIRPAVEVWCQAPGLAEVLIKLMLTMRIQHRTRHGAVAVVPQPTAL